MKIYLKMTFEEFVERFNRDVTKQRRMPLRYHPHKLKDEFRGFVNMEKSWFWFQKTRPRFASIGIHRHFEGTIFQDDFSITISGKNTHGMFNNITTLFCFIVFIYITVGKNYGSQLFGLKPSILVVIVFVANEILERLLFRQENRAVIEYLEALRDEYADRETERL